MLNLLLLLPYKEITSRPLFGIAFNASTFFTEEPCSTDNEYGKSANFRNSSSHTFTIDFGAKISKRLILPLKYARPATAMDVIVFPVPG